MKKAFKSEKKETVKQLELCIKNVIAESEKALIRVCETWLDARAIKSLKQKTTIGKVVVSTLGKLENLVLCGFVSRMVVEECSGFSVVVKVPKRSIKKFKKWAYFNLPANFYLKPLCMQCKKGFYYKSI